MPRQNPRPPQGPITIVDLLVGFYKIFRWFVLAFSVTVLVLILWPQSPPDVQIDPSALESLQEKMQRSARPTMAASRQIRLNEGELNGWMRSNLAIQAEAPAPPPAPTPEFSSPNATLPPTSDELTVEQVQSNVRDVKVRIEGDKLYGYVLFDLYGKKMTLTLDGRLIVKDGYLRLEPTAMKLGSLPIPRATLERAVSQLFDAPENREQFRVPPHIRDIRIENSELVVDYR